MGAFESLNDHRGGISVTVSIVNVNEEGFGLPENPLEFCYYSGALGPLFPTRLLCFVRSERTESLGEVVFGHLVRGPLDAAQEAWYCPQLDRPESTMFKSVMSSKEH